MHLIRNQAVTRSGSVPARGMLQPGNWPQWADLHVSNSPLHIWLLSLTAGGHHRHRLSCLICSLALCNMGYSGIKTKQQSCKCSLHISSAGTWGLDTHLSHVRSALMNPKRFFMWSWVLPLCEVFISSFKSPELWMLPCLHNNTLKLNVDCTEPELISPH